MCGFIDWFTTKASGLRIDPLKRIMSHIHVRNNGRRKVEAQKQINTTIHVACNALPFHSFYLVPPNPLLTNSINPSKSRPTSFFYPSWTSSAFHANLCTFKRVFNSSRNTLPFMENTFHLFIVRQPSSSGENIYICCHPHPQFISRSTPSAVNDDELRRLLCHLVSDSELISKKRKQGAWRLERKGADWT